MSLSLSSISSHSTPPSAMVNLLVRLSFRHFGAALSVRPASAPTRIKVPSALNPSLRPLTTGTRWTVGGWEYVRGADQDEHIPVPACTSGSSFRARHPLHNCFYEPVLGDEHLSWRLVSHPPDQPAGRVMWKTPSSLRGNNKKFHSTGGGGGGGDGLPSSSQAWGRRGRERWKEEEGEGGFVLGCINLPR